jgi:hypothetical protein
MSATCDNCGKVFRFAESIAKYHGWCLAAGPRVNKQSYTDTLISKGYTVKGKSPLDGLLKEAHVAGAAAAEAMTPQPMRVVERVNAFDDDSAIKTDYGIVADGVCGFAWVVLKGNTAIARAAKKVQDKYTWSLHKGYPSGVNLWVFDYNQSMQRKEAYARAFAKVLSDAGHYAYSQSRMD